MTIEYLDVCADALALIAFAVIPLLLELRVSGLLAIFNTAEEVFEGHIKVLDGSLQRG